MASTEEGKVQESAPPRESLIGTAVKFLQNQKVRDSPFPQRKNFLKQKGLTDEEIQLAIERSGTAGDEASHPAHTSQNQSQLVAAGHQPVPVVQTVPVSKWSKFRDFTSTAIVLGGVSYAVYMILKHYLVPHLFKPSREQQQLEKLAQSVNQLQETVTSVLQSIQETQKTLADQQEVLKQTVVDSAAGRGSKEMLSMQNTQFVNEIKEEVKSLKGLLLSRRQFPVAPTTTPVLPAWQLPSSSKSEGSSTSTTESSNKPTPVTDSAAGGDQETSQLQSSSGASESLKRPTPADDNVSEGGNLQSSQSESSMHSLENRTEKMKEEKEENTITSQILISETREKSGGESVQDDELTQPLKSAQPLESLSPTVNGVMA